MTHRGLEGTNDCPWPSGGQARVRVKLQSDGSPGLCWPKTPHWDPWGPGGRGGAVKAAELPGVNFQNYLSTSSSFMAKISVLHDTGDSAVDKSADCTRGLNGLNSLPRGRGAKSFR